MSGLEKMRRQILEEADHSAEAEIEKAKAKAEELLEAAKAEADAAAEKILEQSEADVEILMERSASSCYMYRKKAMLKAKQEVIREVLEKAYEKIQELDAQEYFEMAEKLLAKYVLAQEGEVYFSKRDLERMPEGFEQKISQIAAQKGGALTVSQETRQIDGGFILVYGGIEENCTIKALFDAKRDELSDKVHSLLFA